MKRILSFILIALTCATALLQAQIRGNNITVIVTPDHKDWQYKSGEKFGYNDDVVPPTTAYATFNTVTAPKEISPYQQTAHFWYQEQWDEWVAWLLDKMNVGK